MTQIIHRYTNFLILKSRMETLLQIYWSEKSVFVLSDHIVVMVTTSIHVHS